MQPPDAPMPDELRAANLMACGQRASTDAYLDPRPARSRPHFQDDAVVGALSPEAGIERHRLVPGARRHGRTVGERLAFDERFLTALLPPLQVVVKGFGRAESGIDGSAAKHGRDIFSNLREEQNRMGMLLCDMGELL